MEVARILKDHSLISAPVVNKRNVIKVVQQETEEEILKINGVSSEADINAPIYKTIIQRLPWLLFNLLAGTICSIVIGHSPISPVISQCAFRNVEFYLNKVPSVHCICNTFEVEYLVSISACFFVFSYLYDTRLSFVGFQNVALR
ncbi:hypothetical protein X798_02625 [Onchocerca flexuosa]|uniref:Uncharacterized protein n=1 Tax=Onchocerca flexuosa TaxID=387005 RepID=A0A238C069_9BILA|nr:hypothetical protein X798_02625 [Onchocerca flexuosa]